MRKAARKLPPVGSHQWIDAINLAMARAIARKIRREPQLYGRARRQLARWEKAKRACPPPLREWKNILTTQSREEVLRLLTRDDDNGQRLRQCDPFCGILTQQEVELIWAKYDQGRV